MNITVGSVYNILHEQMDYQKVCAQWIPQCLTPELKQHRIDVCSVLLEWYGQKIQR
jgi:hypothetical protein